MLRTDKVRELTAEQLGIILPEAAASEPPTSATSDGGTLLDGDPTATAVRDAIKDGYSGAILTGVPGTGKSRMASLIANMLTGGEAIRAPSVQFHPSYQYEDFIEGFVPDGVGFTRQLKTFGLLCLEASENPGDQYILIIDEISRADVARVFGEALTYIERSKRNRPFKLASGTELIVPENIFIIATMNPWDRGVEELDAALERRFAFIDMPPREQDLRDLLTANKLDNALVDRAVQFFAFLKDLTNERCHLGHGFFVHARDKASLDRLWDLQLSHVLKRACRDDEEAFAKIKERWNGLMGVDAGAAQA
jgi:5-methylcytosine-specific restriction protein B